nr:N-terminal acetyltransferase A complex auxiliary subunit NAA15 [Tanacetum cinerariifolium]
MVLPFLLAWVLFVMRKPGHVTFQRSVVAEMIFYLEPNKQAEAVKLIEESSNNIASRLILFLKPWLRMKRYGTIDSL